MRMGSTAVSMDTNVTPLPPNAQRRPPEDDLDTPKALKLHYLIVLGEFYSRFCSTFPIKSFNASCRLSPDDSYLRLL